MQGAPEHSSRQCVQYAAACNQEVGPGQAVKELCRPQAVQDMLMECCPAVAATEGKVSAVLRPHWAWKLWGWSGQAL